MQIFPAMAAMEHEQVLFCYDRTTGLRAIIAIHDTSLGPALGGCRMWPYASEKEALEDALRLSKGMTYKCTAAGVDCGGGKAVIIGDPQRDKSEELFLAFGTFVETLKGRFYTGTDVGTTGEDFVQAARETRYLVGLPEEYGGSGDSSVTTAEGVLWGMKACAEEVFGNETLDGLTVAVQGLGKVGEKLVRLLAAAGARLVVTDVDPDRVEQVRRDLGEKVAVVAPEEIYRVTCDIFSPNALGGVINEETVSLLRCRVVAGAANNVLAAPEFGDRLHARQILYAPDYVINAGGLIQVADELHGFNRERVRRKTAGIYKTLRSLFARARAENRPPFRLIDDLVAAKLERVAAIRRKWRAG